MRSTPARVKTDDSVRDLDPAGPGARARPCRSTRLRSSRGSPPSRSRSPLASGLFTPGSTRAGRTLAYWSKPWQIGRRRPQSEMWSGTSRRADRAEEDRVEGLQLLQAAFGDVVAGLRGSASELQSKCSNVEREAVLLREGLEHLDAGGDHFRPMPSPGIAAIRVGSRWPQRTRADTLRRIEPTRGPQPPPCRCLRAAAPGEASALPGGPGWPGRDAWRAARRVPNPRTHQTGVALLQAPERQLALVRAWNRAGRRARLRQRSCGRHGDYVR